MALGRNSRSEGRKLSNYYSTLSIIVLVAFSLLGIWVLMSSIVPILNPDIQVSENINEVKNIVGESGPRKFEHATDENQREVIRESSDENNDSDEGSRNAFEEKPRSTVKDIDRNLNLDLGGTETPGGQNNDDNKFDINTSDNRLGTEKDTHDDKHQDEIAGETEEKEIKKNVHSKIKQTSEESLMESSEDSQASKEVLSASMQSGTLNEATAENGNWSTQASESQQEKGSQKSLSSSDSRKYEWKLCNSTAGPEYIPCLDNWHTIRRLRSIKHYEHWERHCPDEAPTCLVPLPEGYRIPIKWPKSREMVSY